MSGDEDFLLSSLACTAVVVFPSALELNFEIRAVKELVTPKQVAQAIGVSESSVKRWCDQGLIPTIRTAGGHRRLPINAVLSYLRHSGQQLVAPEVLGLPPATIGASDWKLERERERLIEALTSGNEQVCTQIIINLYLSRHSAGVICDEVLASAFHAIGDRWSCGDVAVYQERRSCELCLHILHELRRMVAPLPNDAPMAVGGTLDGDPYTLATAMAELTLRDVGWRASSLGNMLPFNTLRWAICELRPRLFWLSVSSIRDEAVFQSEFEKLYETASEQGTALVVGGAALTEDVRRRLRYSSFCDTFQQLDAFARTLHRPVESE